MFAADNSPVFVAGYPRSGTTLLYRILARSLEFAAVREAGDYSHEIAISVYMNPLLDLRRVYRQPWPTWRTVIADERHFDEFAYRMCQLSVPRRLIEQILTEYVFKDGAFLRSPLDVDSLSVRGLRDPAARPRLRRAAMRLSRRKQVVRAFLNLYAEQASAPRILEKYPFTYYRFDELATALPQARFVFLVRHPCDVFASMVRRARLELRDRIPIGRVSWMLLSADAFVQDWLSSLRAGRSFASRMPQRAMIVRYEDLSGDPRGTIRQIASFLNLAGDDLFTDTAELPDPRRRFPLSSAAPVVNAGRYLAELADEDLATIRLGCERVLAELGYES